MPPFGGSYSYGIKMPIGGEEVAYLAGYLGRMLYEDVQLFICDCRKHKREKLCVKRIKKK